MGPRYQSETIGELAKALCAAQAQLEGAKKDNLNPHFRSKYADLAACWDAARQPLTKNGLAVTQTFDGTDSEGRMVLRSTLMHASGEWIASEIAMPMEKQTPQGMVAASTYARRAALCGLVGISPADDDGETAEGRGLGAAPAKKSAATRVKKKVAEKKEPAIPKEHAQAAKDLGIVLRNRGMTVRDCVDLAQEMDIPYNGGKPTTLSVEELQRLIKRIEQLAAEEVPF